MGNRQKDEREAAWTANPASFAGLLEELEIPLEEVKEALKEGGYLE